PLLPFGHPHGGIFLDVPLPVSGQRDEIRWRSVCNDGRERSRTPLEVFLGIWIGDLLCRAKQESQMPASAAAPDANPVGVDTVGGRLGSDESNGPSHVSNDIHHTERRTATVPDGEDGEPFVEERAVAMRRQDAALFENLLLGQEPKSACWCFSKLLKGLPRRTP